MIVYCSKIRNFESIYSPAPSSERMSILIRQTFLLFELNSRRTAECVYVITPFMHSRVRMPDDLTSDRRLENRVTFSLVNMLSCCL